MIRHWIARGELAPVASCHPLFPIWAATRPYADFTVQVQAVMAVPDMIREIYGEIEASLCRIALKGLLPGKDRG